MLDAALGPAPDLTCAAAEAAQESWRTQLRAWTLALFEQMAEHPWTQEVAIGARPLGPNEIGWFEAALGALADTGLSGPERLDSLVLLSGHARNLAVQLIGSDGLEQEMAHQLAHTLSGRADRYPQTIAAFAESGPRAPRTTPCVSG
jgi:hypothetical protein